MMLKDMACIYCDTKFSVETYANYSVICPCCKRNIFLECEYGPVTPCRIYLGSETAGIVESEGNRYYLTTNSAKIPLSKTYLDAIGEASERLIKQLGISHHSKNIDILTQKGSLCFYGDWFGRPYDNCHKIIHTAYDGEILEIQFDQHERLLVYNPERISSTEQELKIEKAQKVKWIYIPYQSTSHETHTITYTVEGGKLVKETTYGVEHLSIREPFCAVYMA